MADLERTMPNAILDPTGRLDRPSTFVPARRPARLSGATVALVVTPKQNADIFMEEVGRLLREREGAADVVLRKKTSVAHPLPDDVLDELAARCDAMVAGVGDCGSCSAAAVADGVVFEKRGIPSAVICTDAFTVTGDEMARLQGAPGYRYATTSHPIAVLTPDEVRQRAAAVLPQVVGLLGAAEGRDAA